MTDEEWLSCAFLIRHTFKGEFLEKQRTVYKQFLGRFDVKQVEGAVHKLVEEGVTFMPSAAELVQAARSLEESPVPGWTEVYRWLMRALHKGGQRYTAPEQEKTAAGAEFLREKCHPVVAAFFEAEGYGRLSRIEFGDETYGELRIRDLKERFEEFVDVARARLEQGLALEAVGMRKELGPARLDAHALLEGLRPVSAGELEAGPSEGS